MFIGEDLFRMGKAISNEVKIPLSSMLLPVPWGRSVLFVLLLLWQNKFLETKVTMDHMDFFFFPAVDHSVWAVGERITLLWKVHLPLLCSEIWDQVSVFCYTHTKDLSALSRSPSLLPLYTHRDGKWTRTESKGITILVKDCLVEIYRIWKQLNWNYMKCLST